MAKKNTGKRTLVYDTETTGLLLPQSSPLAQQPRIIEFAVAEIDAAYKIVSTHSWLINPGHPLPEVITKITGLKDEDLVDQPTFIQALPEIESVFVGVDRIIAHNLSFDMGMLTNELKRIGREFAFPYPPNQLCTVQLANELIYGRRAKLTELYEKTTGKPLAQTHRAMDDVMALIEIVKGQKW